MSVAHPGGPESLTFGRSLTGRRKTISDLLRPNALYLSVAAAAQNHELLGRLHRWFRDGLRTASDGDYQVRLNYTVGLLRDGDSRSRNALTDLLRFSDLGVTELEFHEPDQSLLDETQRIEAALRDAGVAFRVDAPDHRVRVRHRTESGTFALELDEESA